MIEVRLSLWYSGNMKAHVKRKPQKTLTLKRLAQEVGLLRSFVIGMAGQDKEGMYKPEFIEDTLRISESAPPCREFLSPTDFLRRIRSRV